MLVFPAITGVAGANKCVVALKLAVQLLAPVTVTVNVEAVFTFTPIVVAEVDQRYWVYPKLAVRVVLLPGQKVKLPMIKGDGGVSKPVVALLLPMHPLLLVTVTVNVEAVFTRID